MNVDIDTSYQQSFRAAISPNFERFMRSYLNNGKNRLQNNYRLNNKLEDYKKYGYDEYTINLVNKPVAWGNEYSLVATKEGQNIEDGIFLIKKNSVKQIIDTFLNMNKNYFKKLMFRNHNYNA